MSSPKCDLNSHQRKLRQANFCQLTFFFAPTVYHLRKHQQRNQRTPAMPTSCCATSGKPLYPRERLFPLGLVADSNAFLS